MSGDEFSEDFLKKLHSVTDLRPRRVIDHILKYGHVTTIELGEQYGYLHPPRGAQDVKDQGIPLVGFKITNEQGRKIHAYKFGNPEQMRSGMIGGRRAFPKAFKPKLVALTGEYCAVCSVNLVSRYLQVDHRIPYMVSGEGTGELNTDDFMLLCGSCNRAKSWSCEHCENGTQLRDASICVSCYWANPRSYKHIAMLLLRRLDIVWQDEEIEVYERLREIATHSSVEMPQYVKDALQSHVEEIADEEGRH